MYVGFITSIELKSKITIAQRKGRGKSKYIAVKFLNYRNTSFYCASI